jgi:hypothetical protein
MEGLLVGGLLRDGPAKRRMNDAVTGEYSSPHPASPKIIRQLYNHRYQDLLDSTTTKYDICKFSRNWVFPTITNQLVFGFLHTYHSLPSHPWVQLKILLRVEKK